MAEAKDVARYIIDRFASHGDPLTISRLHDVMYSVWNKYFFDTRTYLFSESFEATATGPVIPSVQDEFGAFGNDPIQQKYDVYLPGVRMDQLDVFLRPYIGSDASILYKHIRRPGGAWDQTYQGDKGVAEEITFTDIQLLETPWKALLQLREVFNL